MRAAGLRVPPSLVLECALTDADVFLATQRLLGEGPRPTALTVWSPTAAVPALAAAKACGLRVPEDLSVVAYNDSSIATYLDPPLTTVRMPLDEMSRAAVGSLLRMVDGHDATDVVIRTLPVLVERGSTAPPAR